MKSSSLAWELLKPSSESMFAEVVVTGVAGRSMAVSRPFFLRGASGSTFSTESTALRLRAVDGVVIKREPISPQ
jgi:hypothetical protein